MFNDFEMKFHQDDQWTLKYLHVYNGLFVAESENEYKKHNKINIQDPTFEIKSETTKKGEPYYVLTIKGKEQTVYVRAGQKISLEYIIYNAQQNNYQDYGRPMTFVPHLINVESPLYHTRIRNFECMIVS